MIAGVLVEITNKSVDRIFDYQVPYELQDKIKIGARVLVPFATRTLEGFVLEVKQTSTTTNLKKVKTLIDETPILNQELLALGTYMAKDTLSSLMSCYQVMLPKALKAKANTTIKKKYIKVYTYHPLFCQLTKSQQEIIDRFQEKNQQTRLELKDISQARLNTLVKKGLLEESEKEVYRLEQQEEQQVTTTLTADQEKAVQTIQNTTKTTTLLHGVTGSGKTEVYMALIQQALQENKQSIMLVPEISLTPQLIKRFKQHFGTQIALLHSGLSDGEKYDEWRKIKNHQAKIVIGARSAVFAPLTEIGYIILDEEHSSSYKQDATPRYDTKQVALFRANYHHAKLILGSATPTLESYARALKGVYQLVTLDKRINQKPLPEVKIIDMNQEIKTTIGNFSKPLLQAMQETLQRQEQIILLLNRRGYASVMICHECGYVQKCPNCDITLTYHKQSNFLRCHYCGYATTFTTTCPNCHEQAMQELGSGTEKIEEQLHTLFPDVSVIRMDVDTTSKKGMHEKMINDFSTGKAKILLGTQIVAKGLDFQNVTLVGIINADTSLMLPDFHSSEITFDLLSQVAGRAGRDQKEGKVYLQTYNKDHYAIKAVQHHDYQTFFQQEMAIRKKMKYPPYYYLATIHFASKDQQLAKYEAFRCEKLLKKYLDKTILLGPSPATIFKKYNTYRYQLILKYKYQENLKEVLQKLTDYYSSNQKVKLEIDFYPLH